MRSMMTESINVPQGITCHVEGSRLTCSKGSVSVSRLFSIRGTAMTVREGTIEFACPQANKKNRAVIKSSLAHVANMFAGLETPYVYELEICNVHFPMTVKVEGALFVVTNFLGEKQKRVASILPTVIVDVKGTKVTVSSPNLELAGQTAANIEKATHVSKRDRRVFQDGIFITSKCGVPI